MLYLSIYKFHQDDDDDDNDDIQMIIIMYLLNECYADGFFFFIVSYNDYSPKDHRPAGQNGQTTLPTNFVWFEFLPMKKKELKKAKKKSTWWSNECTRIGTTKKNRTCLGWAFLLSPLFFSLSFHLFDF